MTGGGASYRYGGEEFTVVFNGKSSQEAIPHLETLRETIANTPFVGNRASRRSSDRRVNKKPVIAFLLFFTLSKKTDKSVCIEGKKNLPGVFADQATQCMHCVIERKGPINGRLCPPFTNVYSPLASYSMQRQTAIIPEKWLESETGGHTYEYCSVDR